MNCQPLVSIVLPAFNSEGTVGDAITSILLQTYQNWELLFIDDGSRDQTLAIAKGFNDPRIKIFSDGQNKGLVPRLNEGIEKSTGKYLARMDNDDICFPTRLQAQVEFLEQHPEIDLVGTRAVTFVSPSELVGEFPFMRAHEEICARPWLGFYLPHPTWMGRLDWFRKYKYRMGAEDQDLLLRSYPESRFACLPEFHFAYRLRSRTALGINKAIRTSMLRSQVKIFIARRQWINLALSILAYLVKRVRGGLIGVIDSLQLEKPVEAVRPDVVAKWSVVQQEIKQYCQDK